MSLPEDLDRHSIYLGRIATELLRTRIYPSYEAAYKAIRLILLDAETIGSPTKLSLVNKAIAKAIDKGTQFVGLSDFTAFQLAVYAKTSRITWQGPALGEDFGPESEPDDIMQACFEDLCLEQGEGTGWRMPTDELAKPVKINNAVLWGGNLAVLTSLLGTPYFPSVKGGVLFLEDVGEHPYKIERMLTQLFNAGVLQQQKAIVFGQFTSFKLVPHDKGFKLKTVIERLRSQLKIPVLTCLPFGHVPTKVLLPIGAKVDLATEGRDAFLVWGHI